MGIGELSGMPDQMLVLRGEEPCDDKAARDLTKFNVYVMRVYRHFKTMTNI